jgi:hypothetical protein
MANPHIKLALTGNLATFAHQTHLKIARGARIGAERFAARAKLAYRGAVRSAGLGDRVANTVRVDIHPKSAAKRTHAPAVVVWTKAPKILFAFARGVTIRSQKGLWLAIPTEHTPRRGRRLATPKETEAIFGQKLIFVAGRGGNMLAFVEAVRAKSGRGFRRATRRRTKAGREKQLVLMFVMVRQVTLRKRIDWDGITNNLKADWYQLFGGEIAKALAA